MQDLGLFLHSLFFSSYTFFASRWLLPDQRVRQPASDPGPGQGAAILGLPDARGPRGAEGVELQTEPRGPETEREPAEPSRRRLPRP